MKRLGKIAVCLAGGLALSAGLRAANPLAKANPFTVARPIPAVRPVLPGNPAPAASPAPAADLSSDNPYATIASRNIFGLIPPAPPPDPTNDILKSLPKITAEGIMGVFGDWQVLFKVAPVQPGPGAKDQFYTLSPGQRQDDIEVVNIDQEKGIVTFDNHGFTQELPLADAPSAGGNSSYSPGGNPGMGLGQPGRRGPRGPGGFTQFGGGTAGNNDGTPNGNPGSNGGDPNSANGGMNSGNSLQSHIYQPEASTLTKDETTILIEAERAKQMTTPNPEYAPTLLPPTELTKFNTGEEN